MNVIVKLGITTVCFALGASTACGGGDEGDGGGATPDGSAASAGMGGSATGGNGGGGNGGGGNGGGGNGGSGNGGSGNGGSGNGGSGNGGSGNGGGMDGGAGASGSAGASVGGSAGASVGGSAGASVGGSAGASVGGSAGASVGGSAGASVGGSAGASVGGSAGASVGGSAGKSGAGGVSGSAGTGAGGTAGSSGNAGAAGGVGDAGSSCSSNADCDDLEYCDGAESCVGGVCVPGTPIVCPDDGKTCSLEICDESTKSCQQVLQDSACSDGQYCNGAEKCAPAAGAADSAGCIAGTPPSCNDNIGCTVDACNELIDACSFIPSDATCADGNYCNGNEQCVPSQGGCVAGQPVDCEDGLACTADACNDATNSCDHVPQHALCNDGLFCNGSESCSPTQGCVGSGPVQCPGDGLSCTLEQCDESADACATTLDSTLCPAGQFCTFGGCLQGTPCSTDAECSDGIACNGSELCDLSTTPGVCKPGTAVDCNDGIACTFDQCSEPSGSCTHTPFDGFCNDGDACNGNEVCSTTSGCTSGTPLACDDGIACTLDTCISSFGCQHTPNDEVCQDGAFCNGEESCSPQTGCQPAAVPVFCPDDGIACTTESCSESQKACVSLPDDSLCTCGQSCSVQQGGCGNFCTVTTCQGHVYQCGNCLDDDGDCRVDSSDPHCIGVCSNSESGFKGNIPGQNSAPCRMDCYFDQDTGAGNDDCYWNHKCDPFEVPPNFNPQAGCDYDPNAKTPGTNQSCAGLSAAQSSQCLAYCGPLTPNGCDCFGCCAIPGAASAVYLGSEDASGTGSCTLSNVGDPTKCKPCTQVPACLNTCDNCEICVGKPNLPPECGQQQCPSGKQLCGQPGQPACPSGEYCVTGCCQPVPS